jgi:hypothetical protein
MQPSRILRSVVLVHNDVSEKHIASVISVTRIDELGLTLAISSNRRILMMEAIHSSEISVPTRVTRHNIPQDDIAHSHRRESLRFCGQTLYNGRKRILQLKSLRSLIDHDMCLGARVTASSTCTRICYRTQSLVSHSWTSLVV